MFQTNLKKRVEAMEVGESVKPTKGYKEITLRNYASTIGKAMGRKYSVRLEENKTYTIIRTA